MEPAPARATSGEPSHPHANLAPTRDTSPDDPETIMPMEGRELARWQVPAVGRGASVAAAVSRRPFFARSGPSYSVSSSRPANRACGSPAHGLPTSFTAGIRRQSATDPLLPSPIVPKIELRGMEATSMRCR